MCICVISQFKPGVILKWGCVEPLKYYNFLRLGPNRQKQSHTIFRWLGPNHQKFSAAVQFSAVITGKPAKIINFSGQNIATKNYLMFSGRN
jgi:hypothetical protein